MDVSYQIIKYCGILIITNVILTNAESVNQKKRVFLSCKECFGHARNPTANKHCKGGCNRYVDWEPPNTPSLSKPFTYPTQYIDKLLKASKYPTTTTTKRDSKLPRREVTKFVALARPQNVFSSNLIVVLCVTSLLVIVLVIAAMRKSYMTKRNRNRISFSEDNLFV